MVDARFGMRAENLINIPGGVVKRNYYLSDVAEVYRAEEGPASRDPMSWISAVKKIRADPALSSRKAFAWEDDLEVKQSPRSDWQSWTFGEFFDEAEQVGSAMVKSGVQQCEGAAVWGFNSNFWAASLFGGILSGVIGLGIYPTDSDENIAYKILHTNSRIIFVSDAKKQVKILNLHNEGKLKFPDGSQKLDTVVTWGDDAKVLDGGDLKFFTWDEFKNLGDEESMQEVKARQEKIQPGNCCCLIYTSGTTGQPKACMLSHDAAVWTSWNTTNCLKEDFPAVQAENRILSYLPLSHIFGLMLDIFFPIAAAAQSNGAIFSETYFARPTDLKAGTLVNRIQSVQPTIFAGVPRVWEKFALKLKAKAKGGVVGKMIGWAKDVLKSNTENAQVGNSGYRKWGSMVSGIVPKIVMGKIGLDKCTVCITGAAPMSAETAKYLASVGLKMIEGYGMSETCAVSTLNRENYFKWGTIGCPAPGVEVRVFNSDGEVCAMYGSEDLDKGEIPEQFQGEIRVRGRSNMMGYMINPELGGDHEKTLLQKNADAITDDGWIQTGDKGACSNYNLLKITGRYKELIITAGGENVAPVPIENKVKAEYSGISNIMMYGDQRPYNVAIVTLLEDGYNGQMPGNGLDNMVFKGLDMQEKTYTTVEDVICEDSNPIIDAIRNAIITANKTAANNAMTIKKFTILKADFSVSTGELTPTLKTKRSVIGKKLADIIEKIYNAPRQATYVKAY